MFGVSRPHLSELLYIETIDDPLPAGRQPAPDTFSTSRSSASGARGRKQDDD
jgi:hypothetical protein